MASRVYKWLFISLITVSIKGMGQAEANKDSVPEYQKLYSKACKLTDSSK